MSGVGSAGAKGGVQNASQTVAETIVKGEKEIDRLSRDIVENGGSKKDLLLLSETVKRQAQFTEAVSNIQKQYHQSAQQMISNLKG